MIELNNWKVKVYTISKSGEFDHPDYYLNVVRQLPNWLEMKNSFNSEKSGIAFLILHDGSGGIFSLVNWLVGQNMLHTNIYLSEPDKSPDFELISEDGLAPCIWELEVINHERISWMENILKAKNPNFPKYLNDVVNTEI